MKKLKFLISLLTDENHYQLHQGAAVQEAAQRLGVEAQVLYAGNDAITQSEQLLNAIQSTSKGIPLDGIICYPVGTTLVQVARQAAAAGIGWAVLNRECDYIAELRASFQVPIFSVRNDNTEIGRIQGKQVSALLPNGGLVLYILGPSVSSITQLRSTWMQSAKPSNIQVRTLIGNWSEQSGYKTVSRWLQLSTSHASPVALVAAQNDDMAIGARKAFAEETRGGERERWASLPYIGCDCCPGAGQDWVRKGLLTASIINPTTAGRALEMMVQAIQSKSQPSEYTLMAPTSFPPLETLGGSVARKAAL
ncbi:MAG TPA: substrate-binding domain-containing protein [Terriglobales bacterium]|nr:substrate-binding domain-containing protein [Terriglobales bacterium]